MKREENQVQRASRIDWKEVHARLQRVRMILEDGGVSPEEKDQILDSRAKMFAQESKDEGAQEGLGIHEFFFAYDKYGMEYSCVREIYPLKEFTSIPGLPAFVLGVINLRGQILSVLDLKKFFELPER